MEERNKYFIQRKPGENARSFNQKMNDMVALRYLTIFGNNDGNIQKIKASSVAIQKFLNKTQTLKTAPNSLQMQDNLIYILNHWSEYKGYRILETIRSFVVNATDTPVSSEDATSVFKKMTEYYQSDKNNKYFSLDTMLQDLKSKTINDDEAIDQFNFFKDAVLKDAKLVRNGEGESESDL